MHYALEIQDILCNVFGFLDIEQLKVCRQVSKLCYRACETHVILRIRAYAVDLAQLSSTVLQLPLDSRKKIYEVFFISLSRNMEVETEIVKATPNLKVLSISDCYADEELPSSLTSLRIGDMKLEAQTTINLPNLRSLYVSELSVFSFFMLQKLPLTYLHIYGCKKLNKAHLSLLPTSLTHLSLWFNKNLESLEGMQSISSNKKIGLQEITNLRIVDIVGGNTSSESLQYLPSSVKNLELDSLRCLTEDFPKYLPSFLTSLKIRCLNIDFQQLKHHLPATLQDLSIFQSNLKISEFTFPPLLKSLTLSNITNSGDISFFNFPTTLKTLNLSNIQCSLSELKTLPKSVTSVKLFYSGEEEHLERGLVELKTPERTITISNGVVTSN